MSDLREEVKDAMGLITSVLASAGGGAVDFDQVKSIGATGAQLTVQGPLKCLRTAEQVAFTASGDVTSLTAAANTVYHQAALTDNCTVTLPTQANSSVGDFIKFILTGAIATTKVLKFGVANEFFAAGSTLTVPNGSDTTRISVVSVANGTSNDFLNITGLNNGDGGIGSTVDFLYNGSAWEAKAVVYGQGTGAVASANTGFADA